MARSPSTKRSLWLAGAVALIAVAAAAGLAPVRGSVAAAAARSATASVTGKRVSGADASASSSHRSFPFDLHCYLDRLHRLSARGLLCLERPPAEIPDRS